MELAYWPIKGLAEPIRWVLAYAGKQYKDVEITDWDKWCAEKNSLGLDFPNLPYLIDGETRLTESKAIAWYLAATYKPDLLGKNATEQAKVHMLRGVFSDINEPIGEALYHKTESTQKAVEALASSTVVDKLAYLEKFLGDKHYFLGDTPSLADIEFSLVLYRIQAVIRTHKTSNPLEKTPHLVALAHRVQQLSGIKEYRESPAGKRPLSSPGYLAVDLIEE